MATNARAGTGVDRRWIISAVGGIAAVGLAGCATASVGERTATDRERTDTTAIGGGTETRTMTDSIPNELDLREANVVGVEFEREDGRYRFDVTLIHDDDGEDGYANWWQVESLDGERLGRRELLHAHGTREFTRSESIDVPDGVTCVVVRGHDETHGYGGRAVLVNLDSGATEPVRQGPDPRGFDGSDCP